MVGNSQAQRSGETKPAQPVIPEQPGDKRWEDVAKYGCKEKIPTMLPLNKFVLPEVGDVCLARTKL